MELNPTITKLHSQINPETKQSGVQFISHPIIQKSSIGLEVPNIVSINVLKF